VSRQNIKKKKNKKKVSASSPKARAREGRRKRAGKLEHQTKFDSRMSFSFSSLFQKKFVRSAAPTFLQRFFRPFSREKRKKKAIDSSRAFGFL